LLSQDIRFCTAPDGVRIAYAVSGEGPPLVFPSTWQTHLELEPSVLGLRHWIEGLSRRNTLYRADLRGSGLSDWEIPSMEFEDWVRDLEAMVDHAGLDRFALFGLSHGATTAVAYAVRHPERVSHLVLFAASGRSFRATLTEKGLERLDVYLAFVRAFWRSPDPRMQSFLTSELAPAAAPEILASLDEIRRKSMNSENAALALRTIMSTDVMHLLPSVSAPALVLQPMRGSGVSVEQAREVAAAIPNARLVLLEADNHLIQEYEPGWPVLLEQMWRFLGVESSEPAAEHANGHVPLSPREMEVLALVAAGCTNLAIAQTLMIAPATASRHVHNIFQKLGVERRAEAASWWAEHRNGRH
jgi:pimeloyl-ACP methyl ester carboxylesterase/DNA-binding CsgD family transcriptional regulator